MEEHFHKKRKCVPHRESLQSLPCLGYYKAIWGIAHRLCRLISKAYGQRSPDLRAHPREIQIRRAEGGRRMLRILKRPEIEILLKAGHPKTEVARLTGVSLR